MLQVYFIDYGNVAWVTDTNIRYIKQEFLAIPCQGVECYFPGLTLPDHTSLTEKENAR